MTLRNSFPTDLETGLPVLDTRLALSTLIARDTDGNPRVGIIPDSLDPIVTGRSNMSYAVRDHRAVTSRDGKGVEYLPNDGGLVVNTTAAPAANARIDVIYERSRFALNGDGTSLPEIGVVQGTAALNPTAPGIPAGAFEIAEAYVPSGVSSTTSSGVVITQKHPWTAAAGGTVVVRSQAELGAWTPADGSRAFNLSDNGDYVRVSGEWVAPGNDTGWINVPLLSGFTGSCRYRVASGKVELRFDISGDMNGNTELTQGMPLDVVPQGDPTVYSISAYVNTNPANSFCQVYLNTPTGRLRAVGALSRCRGGDMWFLG